MPTSALGIDLLSLPQGEDARARWLGQALHGFALLDAVSAPRAPEWLAQVPTVGALRQAWDQQYHRDGEEVRWREGKDLPPGGQRLASPYDLDARYGVKRGAGWTGYKVHLTETCELDAPHLVTNVETTSATVDDAEMTQDSTSASPGRCPASTRSTLATSAPATSSPPATTTGSPCSGQSAPTPPRPAAAPARSPPWAQAAFSIDWDARQVTWPPGRDQHQLVRPAQAPAAPPSPGFTSCLPAGTRARCGPGVRRRHMASRDAA